MAITSPLPPPQSENSAEDLLVMNSNGVYSGYADLRNVPTPLWFWGFFLLCFCFCFFFLEAPAFSFPPLATLGHWSCAWHSQWTRSSNKTNFELIAGFMRLLDALLHLELIIPSTIYLNIFKERKETRADVLGFFITDLFGVKRNTQSSHWKSLASRWESHLLQWKLMVGREKRWKTNLPRTSKSQQEYKGQGWTN